MLGLRDDNYYMNQALREAEAALEEGEVPVGAVIVHKNKIIARAHNRMEASKDPTAHAEIMAVGAAAAYLDDWRLEACALYVTLEPCPMCAGAVLNSRIPRVVYGAPDKRLGACGSACSLLDQGLLNQKVEVVPGIMPDKCLSLVQEFFKALRNS
jgi:tRNA(adenine34) deaminase